MKKFIKIAGVAVAGLVTSTSLIACGTVVYHGEQETTTIEETIPHFDNTSTVNGENHSEGQANTEIGASAGIGYSTGKSSSKSIISEEATYDGLYTKFVGDEEKDESDDFSLILKPDGTGVSKRDGNEFDVTWKIEDGAFLMTETFMGITIDYTGKITNESLDIFNGEPDDDFTCEYVYEVSK